MAPAEGEFIKRAGDKEQFRVENGSDRRFKVEDSGVTISVSPDDELATVKIFDLSLSIVVKYPNGSQFSSIGPEKNKIFEEDLLQGRILEIERQRKFKLVVKNIET